ncbi:conserved protein, unknown function [Hepatocystis sp. ex Piliocolobus tephrosceles]|nr:conserved protein, unknown function [Hepatocystis sp. ex Piliocolobus tephrosceles]
MGNYITLKIFDIYNDTKHSIINKIKTSEKEEKNEANSLLNENMPINKKTNNKNLYNNQNEQIINKQINNKLNINGDNTENNDIEKIKKENFYLFDESLNSNDIKHPCHGQWFMFWVFAAYLNEKFSESEKQYVHSFYVNFPEQCIKGKGKYCFNEFSKIYPFRAGTREELMMWLQMCENYCRKKAELPVKIFNYNKLLKRWRYDDGYM